jgi:hypothetical protein
VEDDPDFVSVIDAVKSELAFPVMIDGRVWADY